MQMFRPDSDIEDRFAAYAGIEEPEGYAPAIADLMVEYVEAVLVDTARANQLQGLGRAAMTAVNPQAALDKSRQHRAAARSGLRQLVDMTAGDDMPDGDSRQRLYGYVHDYFVLAYSGPSNRDRRTHLRRTPIDGLVVIRAAIEAWLAAQ